MNFSDIHSFFFLNNVIFILECIVFFLGILECIVNEVVESEEG